MPQLDFNIFSSEIFVFSLLFLSIFFFSSSSLLPLIYSAKKFRWVLARSLIYNDEFLIISLNKLFFARVFIYCYAFNNSQLFFSDFADNFMKHIASVFVEEVFVDFELALTAALFEHSVLTLA